MAFWNRKKAPEKAQLEPVEEPVERSEFRSTAGRKRPSGDASFAMEVKLLAIDALDSGLSAPEVAAIIGVSDSSVYQWRKHFKEKGIDGLVRSLRLLKIGSGPTRVPNEGLKQGWQQRSLTIGAVNPFYCGFGIADWSVVQRVVARIRSTEIVEKKLLWTGP